MVSLRHVSWLIEAITLKLKDNTDFSFKVVLCFSRERTQINKVRNERGEIQSCSSAILQKCKDAVREYNE